MPEFTGGGVQYPIGSDVPQRRDLEDLAKSIDDPAGLPRKGKLRHLVLASAQNFPSSSGLSPVTAWEPAAAQGDQGDECGISLAGGETLTVSETGFYIVHAQVSFNTDADGERRIAVRNTTTGTYYAVGGASNNSNGTPSFIVATVTTLAYMEAGQGMRVEAAQTSGENATLSTTTGRCVFAMGKLRLM